MRSLFRVSIPLACALAVALACSEGTVAPATGTLEITTATNGPEPDRDGYSVSVDGVPTAAIGVNATLRDENLFPGDRRVGLAGVAENCTMEGENPRSITVLPGATAAVAFVITCGLTTGTLEITVTTIGASPDSDGYVLRLDEKAVHRIPPNSAYDISRLPPGSYTVGLSDIAANCEVNGEHPRIVTLTGGATLLIDFAIVCS